MEVITYSLRDGQKRSEQYYRDIAAFTDELLAEAANRSRVVKDSPPWGARGAEQDSPPWGARGAIEAFQTYLQQTGHETPRTQAEYTFEWLTLGVLWRTYAGDALGLTRVPRRILTTLVHLRQQRDLLKSAVDFLRGVLGSIFLLPRNYQPAEIPTPTLDHLDQLLAWLAATGDFREEVKRLGRWRDFLASQPAGEATESLAMAISFAAWFEARSETVLGRYTPHVERFLAESHPGYRWQENVIFCGRRRVEYHLNMVGTEILNRAFREAFRTTARKIVLVPPCMKAQPDDLCQAHLTPFGSRCLGCTPGCRIHQLTKLGQKHGFEVLILPHELSVFSKGGLEPVEGNAVGIVGISCALTNVSGGWQTKDLGIPAQGVLLDYCGCRYHWHKQGIPTDINVGQLLRVLNIDPRQSQERRNNDEK